MDLAGSWPGLEMAENLDSAQPFRDPDIVAKALEICEDLDSAQLFQDLG